MVNGTMTNGPTWVTETGLSPVLPPGNRSLQFDGTNDYVTFGQAPSLGLSTFSLEVWFKWTGGGTTTSSGTGGLLTVIPLISKGRGEAEGSNVDMNYLLGIQGGKLAADFEEGPGGPGPLGQNHPIIGNTTITTNVWHHAAATYDGRTWNLYLDGLLDATLDLGSNIPPRSDSIQHAGLATAMTSTGAAAGYFQGILDEARIWNFARTQADIQADMNKEVLTANGLVGRWGMNENTGTTIYDSANTGPGVSIFTLEAWVKRASGGVVMTTGTNGLDGSGGRPRAYPVLTKGMGEGEGPPLDINTNYFLGITETGFIGADFEDTINGGNHPVWGTTVVPIGEWHHIAATYDGQVWKLYFDGNLDKTLDLGAAYTPEYRSRQHTALATGLKTTGLPDATGSGYFSGVIDEARIWNYVRTQSEIQTRMNQEVTTATGLVGRWGMNEGTGTAVGASAGSGINGTAKNGPTWVTGAPFNIVSNHAPNQPVLVQPSDGITGISTSPTLEVTVSDPDTATLGVTFYGRPVLRRGLHDCCTARYSVLLGKLSFHIHRPDSMDR